MPFPTAERVIYEHNPLRQVICQLRFHPILRIDTETPADFQDRVRGEFPQYKADYPEISELLPGSISQHIPAEMRQILSLPSNPIHRFSASSAAWTISLAKDFVALEANRYTRWEEFRDHFELALEALRCVYEPQSATRLGLRYVNIVDRAKLGLERLSWRELIADFALGQFAPDETAALTLEQRSRSLIKLNDEGDLVRVDFGQVSEDDGDDSRKLFMLDHDFYSNKEIDLNERDILGKLDKYNAHNRSLFRWCISDALHRAMGPQSG